MVGFPDLFLWFLLHEVRIQAIPSALVLKFKVVGRLLFPFPPPLPLPPPPPPLEDDWLVCASHDLILDSTSSTNSKKNLRLLLFIGSVSMAGICSTMLRIFVSQSESSSSTSIFLALSAASRSSSTEVSSPGTLVECSKALAFSSSSLFLASLWLLSSRSLALR